MDLQVVKEIHNYVVKNEGCPYSEVKQRFAYVPNIDELLDEMLEGGLDINGRPEGFLITIRDGKCFSGPKTP